MRITDKQLSELDSIRDRLKTFVGQFKFHGRLHYLTGHLKMAEQVKIFEPEINAYKVKLENMFSDTDCINEKTAVIFTLLAIQDTIFLSIDYRPSYAVKDYGRYTEMALKIAPKNPGFNSRNENFSE